jgi:hypothetical protein
LLGCYGKGTVVVLVVLELVPAVPGFAVLVLWFVEVVSELVSVVLVPEVVLVPMEV